MRLEKLYKKRPILYLNYLRLIFVFYCVSYSIHANRKDVADGNRSCWSIAKGGTERYKRRAGRGMGSCAFSVSVSLSLSLPHPLSLSLSHMVSSFMDFFIVVLVDRNSCSRWDSDIQCRRTCMDIKLTPVSREY